MQVPRLRFTIRRLMAVIAVVAFGTWMLIVNTGEALWVGQASIPLEFLILDASTGKPIAGAYINLPDPRVNYATTSGPDGRATLVISATIAGRGSRTRSVNYRWEALVTADEYGIVRAALRDFTLDPRYHSDPAPPPIVIRLAPLGSLGAKSRVETKSPERP